MQRATGSHDPKKYFAWKGAEFASGFLKGAKVGEFETKELFECVVKEQHAEEIFAKADMEIGESFKKKDVATGIKGLDTMVGFIVDLASETGKDKKTPICMDIDKNPKAWKDVGEMIKILKDPKRTL